METVACRGRGHRHSGREAEAACPGPPGASEALGSPTRGPEGLAQEEPPHGSLPWGGAAGAEMGGEEEGAPRSRPQLSPSGAVEASSWMDP